MKSEEARYFYCYSSKLRKFIRDQGIRWVDKGINNNSGKPFWMFERGNELDEVIELYQKNAQ